MKEVNLFNYHRNYLRTERRRWFFSLQLCLQLRNWKIVSCRCISICCWLDLAHTPPKSQSLFHRSISRGRYLPTRWQRIYVRRTVSSPMRRDKDDIGLVSVCDTLCMCVVDDDNALIRECAGDRMHHFLPIAKPTKRVTIPQLLSFRCLHRMMLLAAPLPTAYFTFFLYNPCTI